MKLQSTTILVVLCWMSWVGQAEALFDIFGWTGGLLNGIKSFLFGSDPVFGCNGGDLVVEYMAVGKISCGSSYAIGDLLDAPVLTAPSATADKLYRIILVDTSDTPVHPILHFGASNVNGTSLQSGLDLSSVDSFSGYRGPAPPIFINFIPILRRRLFNYEWIIVEQSGVLPEPSLSGNTNVNYLALLDVNDRGTTAEQWTSYFASGFVINSLF